MAQHSEKYKFQSVPSFLVDQSLGEPFSCTLHIHQVLPHTSTCLTQRLLTRLRLTISRTGAPSSVRTSVNAPVALRIFILTQLQLPLKKFEENDVDVAIDACGVCASDIHTITGGWGEDISLPLCVGHEVIGKVVKVGSKVTKVKVGDRAGVGAQVGADLTCGVCKADQENYCPNQIDTYGAEYPDGTVSQGGFSSHIRANEYFVFKIPDNIDTALAAPMLCAGVTTFSPLKRLGAGPGKKVAILGL